MHRLYGFLPVMSFFMLLFATVPTQAQPSPKQHDFETYWLELSGGLGSLGGASLGASLNYQRRTVLYTAVVDGQYSDEWFSENDRSAWEYGLLVGIATHDERFHPFFASLSAGAALTGIKRCIDNCGLFDGESQWEREFYPGLPLQGRVSWRPLEYMGFGFTGMANINDEKSFGSINFSIQVGRLR